MTTEQHLKWPTALGSEPFKEYSPPAITNHPSKEALVMPQMPQLDPACRKITNRKKIRNEYFNRKYQATFS
jgi:hypothetical protein